MSRISVRSAVISALGTVASFMGLAQAQAAPILFSEILAVAGSDFRSGSVGP